MRVREGNIGRIGARAGIAVAGASALLLFIAASNTRASAGADDHVEIGESRPGSVTVAVPTAVSGITVTRARAPGRPIVVIDPGHGGRDPGATAVSGEITEKALTLALARELRQRLADRGRVRVALTRDGDDYLTLDQRAGIARQLGASLFLSLHMDSAPNPLARGATIYSLSDVASDVEAARFAHSENVRATRMDTAAGSVPAILADLAFRTQMESSAELATRLVRKSTGRLELRPEPHRFASFHVLRRSAAPAVLFEAGYVSNADDELLLRSPEHRKRIVAALAEAIETEVARRSR